MTHPVVLPQLQASLVQKVTDVPLMEDSNDSSDSHQSAPQLMEADPEVEECKADPRGMSLSDLATGQSAAARLPSLTATASLHERQWSGFKLVGDNIHKNVRHTYQRLGQETMSLHYFHHFAVLDRVDFGQLPNVRPSIENLDIDDLQMMQSAEDITDLEDKFAVLVSRYIDTYTYVYNTKN